MTIKDAINRTNNLMGAVVVSIAGFAFGPEVFLESEPLSKLEDLGLVILGIVGIIWYRSKKNRFSRSIAPVVLVVAGLAIKIFAVVVEIKDKEDVGDDFGGMILFLTASIVITWLYLKSKKLLAENR